MYRWSSLAMLSLTLTACSQQAGAPDVSRPDPVANYDHIDGSWAMTPKLSAQALTPDGINTLYYERALVATSAWGPIEVNRSNGERGMGDGRTLTLNGTTYPRGYGLHAPSELKYSLAGTDHARCVRFKAQVGVDDEVGHRGSVVFQVWSDGEKLYDSGVMTGASATQQVSVDLRGKSTFRMVVTDAGDGKSYDHADWINPTLTCVPTLTLSVPEETRIPQDTSGSLPLTFHNQSTSFRGNLSYHLLKFPWDNEPANENGIRLKTAGTFLGKAGTSTQTLPLFVSHRVSERLDWNGWEDTLVVSYAGEEVTRVRLNVNAVEQFPVVTLPTEPIALRAGQSVTLTVPVGFSPGGSETTDFEMWAHEDLNVTVGREPWYTIRGGGAVSRHGGSFPVTITAVRAPTEEELGETPYAFFLDQRYAKGGRKPNSWPVELQFVP